MTQPEWEQAVLGSPTPVLADFWAEWCGQCKMVAPIVNQIVEEFGSRLRVVKVNADANSDLFTEYGVMGIPILLLLEDGETFESIAGYQPKRKFLGKLIDHI